jgi:PAS domain-containing protein
MILPKKSPKNKALAVSDELTFMGMFGSQSAVIVLMEPRTGKMLDANQAAVDFYGYPKSKLCGLLIQELIALPVEQAAA